VTGDDLIVAAPWLAFAAGLAVLGWRPAAVADAAARRGPAYAADSADPGPTTSPFLQKPARRARAVPGDRPATRCL
jgi:hypothetical protein